MSVPASGSFHLHRVRVSGWGHFFYQGTTSARLGGQSLRYVAEVDGQWVALMTFSGAAPHTKAREHKIRWTPRQRARRLCFVVNNSRFLVLPERQRYPNLASRVLALCLKRLQADWQEHWGHPVVLVESYVDESQYRGTCYRACGFDAVGLTAGYGRSSRDYYLENGKPKQLYLRELCPRAIGILRQARLPAHLAEHEEKISGPCPFRATQLNSLLEVLEQCKSKVIQEFEEYSFYCTSAAPGQYSAAQLLQFIRDHWAASENGAHYRRDVSLGEDACRISGRTGAYVMATLRNLLLGLFELQQHRGTTKARTLPGWRRKLTNTEKIQLLTRTL